MSNLFTHMFTTKTQQLVTRTPSFASNRAAIHSSLPIIQGEVVRRLSLAKRRHWLRSRRQSRQRHEPAAGPFHNHMFNPILKSAKSSHDTFDVDLYLFDASGGKWRHGSLQPDWIDLVDGQPVAAGARRSSASRRSPQQIGFIPAHRLPDAPNKRKSCAAVWVSPTPVSVPVMKGSRDLSRQTRRSLCAIRVYRFHHRTENLCAVCAAQLFLAGAIRVRH